jgi:hypothetical protein
MGLATKAEQGDAAMAMKTDAVLAIWNNVLPESETEFNAWYIRDHLPDRVSLPGFRRGRRWLSVDRRPRYFTFYEIEDAAVMHSPDYLESHENPTDWTRRMMPAFRDMNRSICRVTAKQHRGDGGIAGVVRLTPADGGAAGLRRWIVETVLPNVMEAPDMLSACLWELDAEASRMPDTTETRLREGRDAVVDWVFLVEAARPEALQAVSAVIDAAAAAAAGAGRVGALEPYRLLSALDYDLAGAVSG